MINQLRLNLSFILFGGLVLFGQGCSKEDNPVDPDQSVHLEANGVMLISSTDT